MSERDETARASTALWTPFVGLVILTALGFYNVFRYGLADDGSGWWIVFWLVQSVVCVVALVLLLRHRRPWSS